MLLLLLLSTYTVVKNENTRGDRRSDDCRDDHFAYSMHNVTYSLTQKLL